MIVTITYVTNKTKETRSKAFVRSSVKEALAFFNWRYGHKIIDISYTK